MQETDKKPMVTAVELTIGRYPNLPTLPAKGRYGWERAMVAVVGTSAQRGQGAGVLQQLVLQLLNHLPPHAAQVFLYEDQASEEFAEIKHLLAACHGEFGQQWFSAREAAQGLSKLNEQLIRRASRLAAARQPTIYAFNAGRRQAEPIYFVLLSHLSSLIAHDGQMASVLEHLASKGAACGIIPVLLHDLERTQASKLPAQLATLLYHSLGRIAPAAFGFNFCANLVPYGIGEPYQRFVMDFAYAPDFPAGSAHELGAALLAARAATQQSRPQQDFLAIPLGEANDTRVYFSLGQASNVFNALISGGSGSGKTTVLQHLVLSVCEQYAPSDIELVLIDYGTVSFNPYCDVAHVQYVFDQPENGDLLAQVFAYLVQELHRRKEQFKACGREKARVVDNLRTYQALSGVKLPALLVVIDEFGSLMADDNKTQGCFAGQTARIAIHAEKTINLLVREGRKVGIHLVLVTQSFAKVDRMPQDIKSNPHLALGLKAETAHDSRQLLNSDNDAAYLLGRYQAVLNKQSGQPAGNIIVDLEHITEDDIAKRQADLRQRWPRHELSALARFIANAETNTQATSADEPDWMSWKP